MSSRRKIAYKGLHGVESTSGSPLGPPKPGVPRKAGIMPAPVYRRRVSPTQTVPLTGSVLQGEWVVLVCSARVEAQVQGQRICLGSRDDRRQSQHLLSCSCSSRRAAQAARTGDSSHLPASSEGLQREKVQVQTVSHYRLDLAISFHPVRVLRVDWNIFSFCANSSTF